MKTEDNENIGRTAKVKVKYDYDRKEKKARSRNNQKLWTFENIYNHPVVEPLRTNIVRS